MIGLIHNTLPIPVNGHFETTIRAWVDSPLSDLLIARHDRVSKCHPIWDVVEVFIVGGSERKLAFNVMFHPSVTRGEALDILRRGLA